MGAAKVQRFINTDTERQPGEVARLRVLKGSDQGQIFVLSESSVVLGRGNEAGVRVSDLKASRVHARLDFTREGWMITDLGSANGIFFQGEFLRQFKIKTGEHFTLGETIFEFLTSDQDTRVLMSPLKSGAEVERLDQALVQQRDRVKSISQPRQNAPVSNAPGAKKESKARTLLLLALVAGAYYYTNMMEEPPQQQGTKSKKKKKKEDAATEENASDAQPAESEVAKTADQYYQQGFREFRERNYLRAKGQLELSLQVNPNHWQSKHYLMLTENMIESEKNKLMNRAAKAKSAGRLREAKGYFEAAMRLMYNDQSNPDYIECEEALKKIKSEIERTSIR